MLFLCANKESAVACYLLSNSSLALALGLGFVRLWLAPSLALALLCLRFAAMLRCCMLAWLLVSL